MKTWGGTEAMKGLEKVTVGRTPTKSHGTHVFWE